MLDHCALLDFPEFDPEAEIRSPRSIQACASEGIHPQELIYMPIDTFEDEDVEPLIARLRHDFYETRRQDLLAQARNAWEFQVVGAPLDKSKSIGDIKKLIVDPICSDRLYTPTTPQHRTVLWFKDRAHDFSPHAQALELRSAVDPKFKKSPLSSMASMNRSVSMPSMSSSPSGFRGSMCAAPLHPSYPSLGCPELPTEMTPSKKPRDIVGSDAGLQEMLEHMNSVPGEDTTVEWEMARRTQNNLVTLKEIADRKRAERHSEQNRLTGTKLQAAKKQFKQTLVDHHEKLELRDVREVFSHPERDVRSPRVEPGLQNVRDNNLTKTKNWRLYQERRVGERLKFDQAFDHKMSEKAATGSMRTAQLSMEGRVRWRYQNRNVEAKIEDQKNDLLQGFETKQAKRSNQSDADARQAYLRTELYILREANRKMNDRQKEWKAEYVLEKKKADKETKKFEDNLARSRMRHAMYARATSDSGGLSPSDAGLRSAM